MQPLQAALKLLQSSRSLFPPESGVNLLGLLPSTASAVAGPSAFHTVSCRTKHLAGIPEPLYAPSHTSTKAQHSHSQLQRSVVLSTQTEASAAFGHTVQKPLIGSTMDAQLPRHPSQSACSDHFSSSPALSSIIPNMIGLHSGPFLSSTLAGPIGSPFLKPARAFHSIRPMQVKSSSPSQVTKAGANEALQEHVRETPATDLGLIGLGTFSKQQHTAPLPPLPPLPPSASAAFERHAAQSYQADQEHIPKPTADDQHMTARGCYIARRYGVCRGIDGTNKK
jgi:hypothetical protein